MQTRVQINAKPRLPEGQFYYNIFYVEPKIVTFKGSVQSCKQRKKKSKKSTQKHRKTK